MLSGTAQHRRVIMLVVVLLLALAVVAHLGGTDAHSGATIALGACLAFLAVTSFSLGRATSNTWAPAPWAGWVHLPPAASGRSLRRMHPPDLGTILRM